MPSSFFKKLQTMVDSDENLENIPETEEPDVQHQAKEENVNFSKGEPALEEDEPRPTKAKTASSPKTPRKRKVVSKTEAPEQPKETIGNIHISSIDENEPEDQGLSLRERIREVGATPNKSVFTESDSTTHSKTSIFNSSSQTKDTKTKMAISSSRKWPELEGQLAVDIFETEKDLVIQSAIAGVKPGDLDIDAQGDTVIIKGRRENPIQSPENYFTKECYWGTFSKEIIMPVEADASRAEAKLIDGILTIKIPKIGKDKKSKIVIK